MELTCWWNQLWIIFMNMKSITAAAQSISFIPFVFSLRMRKQIENEMKLKGIAAQWERLGWLFFLNWGVMGGSCRTATSQERRQAQPSSSFHLLWLMEGMSGVANGIQLINEGRREQAKRRRQQKRERAPRGWTLFGWVMSLPLISAEAPHKSTSLTFS